MSDSLRSGQDRPRRASGRLTALALGLGNLLAFAGVAAVMGSAQAKRGTSTADLEPVKLEVKGDFTHPAAGFVMPEAVADFHRSEVVQYDAEAKNISAGYYRLYEEGKSWPTIVTVYVYPNKGTADLDTYFAKLLRDIGESHGGARPGFTQTITLCQGRFTGRYAGFAYTERFGGSDRALPLRSYVVLYPWKTWWVKWRVTMPAPPDGAPIRAMVDLTETLVPPEDEPGEAAAPSSEGETGESPERLAFAAEALHQTILPSRVVGGMWEI